MAMENLYEHTNKMPAAGGKNMSTTLTTALAARSLGFRVFPKELRGIVLSRPQENFSKFFSKRT